MGPMTLGAYLPSGDRGRPQYEPPCTILKDLGIEFLEHPRQDLQVERVQLVQPVQVGLKLELLRLPAIGPVPHPQFQWVHVVVSHQIPSCLSWIVHQKPSLTTPGPLAAPGWQVLEPASTAGPTIHGVKYSHRSHRQDVNEFWSGRQLSAASRTSGAGWFSRTETGNGLGTEFHR